MPKVRFQNAPERSKRRKTKCLWGNSVSLLFYILGSICNYFRVLCNMIVIQESDLSLLSLQYLRMNELLYLSFSTNQHFPISGRHVKFVIFSSATVNDVVILYITTTRLVVSLSSVITACTYPHELY